MDHHHPSTTTTTTQNQTQTRAEAERLLSISEKLLNSRDLTGAREFALLAQETEPLLHGSDQILAITDVLLASEKRVNNSNNYNWYAILQAHIRSDFDLLKINYRRLELLLHPDNNKYPLADSAFKLVTDAWTVLSDPSKRTLYDQQYIILDKEKEKEKLKLPVRRRAEDYGQIGVSDSSFWTACPYCYVLYEYPRVYKECCIRCRKCERAFHGAEIPSMPPMVPGKDGYYCCWGFFPIGVSVEKRKKNGCNYNEDGVSNPNVGFPNWMPGMFTTPVAAGEQQQQHHEVNAGVRGVVDFSNGSASGGFGNVIRGTMAASGAKKRGRPRKNPMGV